jgi:hypothetical protein
MDEVYLLFVLFRCSFFLLSIHVVSDEINHSHTLALISQHMETHTHKDTNTQTHTKGSYSKCYFFPFLLLKHTGNYGRPSHEVAELCEGRYRRTHCTGKQGQDKDNETNERS